MLGIDGFSLLLRLHFHPPGIVKGVPTDCDSAAGGQRAQLPGETRSFLAQGTPRRTKQL